MRVGKCGKGMGGGTGLFAFFYFLMSSNRESGKRHLFEMHAGSLRGSRHIFQQRTFQLDVRKKIIYQCWSNHLPRDFSGISHFAEIVNTTGKGQEYPHLIFTSARL